MGNTVNLQQLKQTAKLPANQAGMGSVKKFFDSQKSVSFFLFWTLVDKGHGYRKACMVSQLA